MCRLDVKKRHIELTASVPLLTVRGRYTADGRVLILPIKGDGDANVTLGKSFQHFLQHCSMSPLLVLAFLDYLAVSPCCHSRFSLSNRFYKLFVWSGF